MTIQVTGILSSPTNGVMADTTIRVTSGQTYGEVVTGSFVDYMTDASGNYDFPVLDGLFQVEVNYLDEFYEVGTFLIDKDTPTPLTIPELLRYTSPIIPPVIVTPKPNWQTLFDDLITHVDTVARDSQYQIADGDLVSSETKELWTNATIDAEMSDESLETSTTNAKVISQPRVYEDGALNQAATDTTTLTTSNGSASESVGIYQESNGNVEAILDTEVVTDTVDISKTYTGGTSAVSNKLTVGNGIAGMAGKTVGANASWVINDDLTDTVASRVEVLNILNKTHTITDNIGAHSNSIDANGKIASVTFTNDGVTSSHLIDTDTTTVGDVFTVDNVAKSVTINGSLVIGNREDFKGDDGDTVTDVYRYSATATLFPDDGSWHAVFVSGDLYRISNTSTNGVVDPNTWSDPAKLAAEDGLDGDTEYWEYRYSVDGIGSWHPVLVDGDLWRQERLVINGVEGAWSASARIAGADGDDGEIVTIEYEYSINGLSLWHANFSTGDHYRRERVVTYEFIGDPNPIYDLWSNPAQIVPIKGTDYLDGYNQATVYLYLRKASVPDAGDAITGDVTYNFTDRTVTGAGLGSWTTSIPTGNEDIYVAAAGASGTHTTETIFANEWSYGLFSSSAINSVPVTIYQRSASLPAAPSGDTTYTFSDGTLTGALGSWTQTIPSGVNDLYACVATAISQSNTDVIGSGEWAVSLFNNSAQNHAQLSIYQRSNTVPTAPTGNVIYTFATGTATGIDNGWSTAVTAGSEPLYIATGTALSSGLTDTIANTEWAISEFSVNGNQQHSVILYQSAVTIPDSPIGNTTYNFDTGTATFADANGWTKNPPANSTGKIWITQATALATAPDTTDVIPDTEWSTAEVFTEVGLQVASVQLFRLSLADLGASDRPSNINTYDFTTNALTTTPNNGWGQTVPDNTLGLPLWATNAGVSTLAINNTDDIPASEWSIPTKLSQSGGQSQIVEIYKAAASSGSLPSATTNYTFSTGVLTGLDNGWSTGFPTNTGKVWMSHALAFVTQGAIDTVDIASTLWSSAELYVENGQDGLDGADGADGVAGNDGESLVWKGDFAAHPANPVNGWAYYNTTDGKSYTYQTGVWYQMTIDGTDGQKGDTGQDGTDGTNGTDGQNGQDGADGKNGLDIVWKGDLVNPPSNPEINWVYRDINNGRVYIWQGTAWELMVLDGSDGSNGANGSDGTNGTDGKDGLNVYITYNDASVSGLPPALPTNVDGTNFGWHTAATNASNWMSQKVGDGTTTNWGAAIRIKGIDGSNGTNGIDGEHGSGSYIVTVADQGAIPDNAGKDTDIANLASRPAQAGDILTYTDVGETFSKQFLRNATVWNSFTLVINGDAIINGTLAAEKLIAGTITGDEISATTRIDVGSVANHYAHISGKDGVDWAIVAGKENKTDTGGLAPFRVGHNGQLVSRNADIEGKITATSGSFAGAVTATSGKFSGSMDVGTANGGTDYMRFYGGNAPSSNGECMRMVTDGKYRVRQWYTGRTIWYKSDGTNYFMDINPAANTAKFYGTIYADQISGDIVGAKAVAIAAQSNSTVWKTIASASVKASTKSRFLTAGNVTAKLTVETGQTAQCEMRILVDGSQVQYAIAKYLPTSTNTLSISGGSVVAAAGTHTIEVQYKATRSNSSKVEILAQTCVFQTGWQASIFN